MVKYSSSADQISGSLSPLSSSSCKFKGVRKRKWGKYVCEIRLPNSRERIWLGSYNTAEKAARAFDAALFCLRGRDAKFNFPDSPPDIPNAGSMTPAEIQAAAAQFAHSVRVQDQGSGSVSQSDSVCSAESISGGARLKECDMMDVPLNLDDFLHVGLEGNATEFGLFSGFEDIAGDFSMPAALPDADYFLDNNEEMCFSGISSPLWNF